MEDLQQLKAIVKATVSSLQADGKAYCWGQNLNIVMNMKKLSWYLTSAWINIQCTGRFCKLPEAKDKHQPSYMTFNLYWGTARKTC